MNFLGGHYILKHALFKLMPTKIHFQRELKRRENTEKHKAVHFKKNHHTPATMKHRHDAAVGMTQCGF